MGYGISFLNYQHPYFPKEEIELEGKSFNVSEFLLLHWGISADLPTQIRAGEGGLEIKISNQTTAIPNWGELLDINEDAFTVESTNEGNNILMFREFLTTALVGPGELIRNELNRLRYIGPIREIPARNYEPKRFRDETRWANGLGAWDVVYMGNKGFVHEVSDWMSREDRLNTGYSVELREYKELYTESPLMHSLIQGHVLDDIEDLQKELNALPTQKRVVLVEKERLIDLLPFDIGVGISQVFPVVVGALDQKSSILTIEQPELHVHPAIQVNLGDLFISQIQDEGCIYLLETHSEHIMLRLLRRIEETTNDGLPPGVAGLKPEQVSVVWFEQTQEGVRVESLPIDETGEFTKQWPKGFFEERAEELLR